MINLLGYIGAFALALCALPQTILCIKQGHARGLSGTFLFLWILGEACTLVYIMDQAPKAPLIINYTFNLTLLSIIAYYWLRGTNEKS